MQTQYLAQSQESNYIPYHHLLGRLSNIILVWVPAQDLARKTFALDISNDVAVAIPLRLIKISIKDTPYTKQTGYIEVDSTNSWALGARQTCQTRAPHDLVLLRWPVARRTMSWLISRLRFLRNPRSGCDLNPNSRGEFGGPYPTRLPNECVVCVPVSAVAESTDVDAKGPP
ncbi:hypothetical protein FF38_06248 [Lucilia cuprina]|uniref:Uncharacterized protein n=1 Tax=Lucilia cuprina TaxID=7375 RepID=A0A0L0C728_LUCCU|nr:hypothetical protein FF38_06248 [Lucilia cuprina]